MSRDRNDLQRHIEDCLAAHREKQEWIRCAQAFERELDEDDPGDWAWGDETFGAPELEEWDDWPQHESEGDD